jgi:hypothetical protein
MTAISTQFGDLLDPRFQRIWSENRDREQLKDMIPTLYGEPVNNGRNNMQLSSVGAFGDFTAFSGTVDYDDMYQGYDNTITPLEFASGFQIERKLYDDDQYNIMDQKPAGLALAAMRTRQKHAARIFNNAFSVDSFFYAHTEGLSLCNDLHTTTAEGVSTASGFDNKITAALSATSLAAARIQMVGLRDDRGNFINSMPDEIWIPPGLYDVAYEIIKSTGKPNTADNNRNVHEGAYTVKEWIYMTDSNNWFLCDGAQRKQHLFWNERVPLEFAYAEDLDTIVAKWRAYMRYGMGYDLWQWVMGAQVA